MRKINVTIVGEYNEKFLDSIKEKYNLRNMDEVVNKIIEFAREYENGTE